MDEAGSSRFRPSFFLRLPFDEADKPLAECGPSDAAKKRSLLCFWESFQIHSLSITENPPPVWELLMSDASHILKVLRHIETKEPELHLAAYIASLRDWNERRSMLFTVLPAAEEGCML